MSKIRVYVRVRPAVRDEFQRGDDAFNCIEMADETEPSNWIRVKKDGEGKRYFTRVWGPKSTQEECFRTIGVNTVNDVFEGYHGCIFVYGQTGTGKTFTLGSQTAGSEGLQPRALKMIYDKAAAMNTAAANESVTITHQYVQLYGNSVQDLLNINNDKLQLRVDSKLGTVIEGVTTRTCTSYEAAMANVVQFGDRNRTTAYTAMNPSSSRSHACLVTAVHRRTQGSEEEGLLGRLYLIDLAGSERVSKSEVQGKGHEEAVAINKSLTTLGACIASLVRGDKAVAFRDSKLTRLLQHSLCGNGRTSIVVTVGPSSSEMQETLCTLNFGERAQKVQTQMTPAGYRDELITLQQKCAEQEREMSLVAHQAALLQSSAQRAAQQCLDEQVKVEQMEESVEVEAKSVKLNLDRMLMEQQEELDEYKRREDAKAEKELSLLKDENRSILRDIQDRVEQAAARLKKKHEAEVRRMQEQLAQARKEKENVELELDECEEFLLQKSKEDEALPALEQRAADRVAELSKTLKRLKHKLRYYRENSDAETKTDMNTKEPVSLASLLHKKERLISVLDHVTHHRDELMRVLNVDSAESITTAPKPTAAQVAQFLEGMAKQVAAQQHATAMKAHHNERSKSNTGSYSGLPSSAMQSDVSSLNDYTAADDDDEDDDLPPPPPSDDEDDEEGEDDLGTSDFEEESSSVLTSTDDDDDETSTESSTDDDDDTANHKPPTLSSALGASRPYASQIKKAAPPPRGHFDHALQRDRHLAELLDQIAEYLEYGCTCYIVNSPQGGENTKKDSSSCSSSIHRRHLFLGKDRKSLCMTEYSDDTSTKPNRATAREIMKLSDITQIVLGQFSDRFATALEGAPMVPQGTMMPPTSSRISLRSLPVFFYRSFTLKNFDTSVVDLVLDTDTDFEAWIVTLHRLTLKDPHWGGPLDITSAKDVHRLTDAEKRLCSDCHILPSCLLHTKSTVLHKEQRLFSTLFDLRSVSSLDLLHAQKLFEFFFTQKYFERVVVFHVRYLETVRQLEVEKKARDELHHLQSRIINMCRKYSLPSLEESAFTTTSLPNVVKDFLRSVRGKEQQTLDLLIKTHGPEPTPAEIDEWQKTAEVDASSHQETLSPPPQSPSEDESDDAPPPPPPPEADEI